MQFSLHYLMGPGEKLIIRTPIMKDQDSNKQLASTVLIHATKQKCYLLKHVSLVKPSFKDAFKIN